MSTDRNSPRVTKIAPSEPTEIGCNYGRIKCDIQNN